MLSPSALRNRKVVLFAAAMLVAGTSTSFAQGGGAGGAAEQPVAEARAQEPVALGVERQFLPCRRQLRQHRHRSSIHRIPVPCRNRAPRP
jgi:hypothetical protein